MSNEAKIPWQSRPAGEIADESQRLIDLLTTWDIDRPRLVSSLHRVHTRVSEMDRESSVEATTLGMMVDVVLEQIVFHLSAKKREFMTNDMRTTAQLASLIKEEAFDRDDEEKAKEAHKNERKKAHQKALEAKGEPPNDEQCEKDAVTDTDWSWFDLKDTQHQQPYIDQEVKSLREWNMKLKDGDGDAAKPPTPVLDRLHFCLKESGTAGLTLNRFVQVCTWHALWNEQKKLLAAQDGDGGRPPNEKKKHDDDDDELVGGSMSAQQILAAIQTRETTLNQYLARKQISPDAYEQSRALLHLVRVHIIEKNGVPTDSAV